MMTATSAMSLPRSTQAGILTGSAATPSASSPSATWDPARSRSRRGASWCAATLQGRAGSSPESTIRLRRCAATPPFRTTTVATAGGFCLCASRPTRHRGVRLSAMCGAGAGGGSSASRGRRPLARAPCVHPRTSGLDGRRGGGARTTGCARIARAATSTRRRVPHTVGPRPTRGGAVVPPRPMAVIGAMRAPVTRCQPPRRVTEQAAAPREVARLVRLRTGGDDRFPAPLRCGWLAHSAAGATWSPQSAGARTGAWRGFTTPLPCAMKASTRST